MEVQIKPSGPQLIAETLLRVVKPDMTPKQLLKAAKTSEAAKKDIVRAAFHAIVSCADTEPEKAKKLHGFAITERTSGGSGLN